MQKSRGPRKNTVEHCNLQHDNRRFDQRKRQPASDQSDMSETMIKQPQIQPHLTVVEITESRDQQYQKLQKGREAQQQWLSFYHSHLIYH